MENQKDLILSTRAERLKRFGSKLIEYWLFLITSISVLAVGFIIIFIAKDAIPFFKLRGFAEFFTQNNWYPSAQPGNFGAVSIFVGTLIVTIGSIIVSVPLGLITSITLSEILPFSVRQIIKPIIELFSAIPSVAYGFFALVVMAPLLQNSGNVLISWSSLIIGLPILSLIAFVISDIISEMLIPKNKVLKRMIFLVLELLVILSLTHIFFKLSNLNINSGTNAFNVSIILGIMALPTIVSVSEDAIQSVNREMKEGSLALGATKTETILKVIIPSASGGILAAIILGIMRAIGETMVVWMASGNAAQIPKPWYNVFQPIRTLTATIAGDMGEADHITGSERYHVLFVMGLCLLIISFISNAISEWIIVKQRKKLKGE